MELHLPTKELEKKFISKLDTNSTLVNRLSRNASLDSRMENLKKIIYLYKFVLEESKMWLRRNLIADDEAYQAVISKIENLINNKIKIEADGTLYININDELKFNGEKEQYLEWLVNKKRNQFKIFKAIVKEIDDALNGVFVADENKTAIFDLTIENITNFIVTNYIPESVLNIEDKEEANKQFKNYFVQAMYELKVPKDLWKDIDFGLNQRS